MALKGLLLVCAVCVAAGVPVKLQGDNMRTQCASFCPANSKFNYELGKTYEYVYETTVTTHLPGATSREGSTLHLVATASIQVLSRCEMTLRLSDVTLKDADPSDVTRLEGVPRGGEVSAALERYPLRFAYVGGRVEGLCPTLEEGADEPWVLNVKRAVLSGLQNAMNDFTVDIRTRESDVTGECRVHYEALGTSREGTQTVRKTRDLDTCSGRLDADTVLQGTPFTTPGRLQSMSLMKGTHTCTQIINSRRILLQTTCHETHTFRPFSSGDGGATTDVKTKLTYKGTRDAGSTIEGSVGHMLPLLYDHTKTQDSSPTARQEAERLLSAMCREGAPPTVGADAPSTFSQLTHKLRRIEAADLSTLYAGVQTGKLCEKAKRSLRDAIPMVGTAASARIIKDKILSSEVTGGELTAWMTSLTFVQSPTAAMLAEVTPLLQGGSLSPEVASRAALAVSSMVNNYCRHRADCSRVWQVRAIVDLLHGMLGTDCSVRASSSSSSRVMIALRALGNTGHAHSAVGTLTRCAENVRAGMDVRVAAVQAFRRIGCTADRSGLQRLYEDVGVDSELRIQAYLALMACPSDTILQRVRARLEAEETNQVGSFVWTHLTNLQESSSPFKQDLKALLRARPLRAKYDLDKRKYSRNVEKSYYSEELGVGGQLESDLLWSAESFVPRAGSVNLTVNLFGQSVNLLEVGGRVEGMDRVLKTLFDKHLPPDDRNDESKDIEDLDRKFPTKPEANPRGSYYLRVFGNEISYNDFNNLDATSLKDKFNYLNWLSQLATDKQLDFSKSVQFLDSTLNIPTISGFPLHMHVEGNAVTDLKVKTKVDIRGLFSGSGSLHVEANIAPSAAVEIKAEMRVDAHVTSSGIRTVTTLHTSTLADAKVEVRGGELVTVDVNMPRDTMDIVTASHNFLVIRGDSARPWRRPPGPRLEASRCLGGGFTSATGLELCGQVSLLADVTSPWAALTSSAAASLSLSKMDTLTKYHFEASLRTLARGHHSDHVRVSFTTPGARTDRELTAEYVFNPRDKALRMALRSPWRKADLRASYDNTPQLLYLSTEALIDDHFRYALKAEVRSDVRNNGRSTRYSPTLEVTLPGRPTATLEASLLHTPGERLKAELEVENLFRLPFTVKGDLNVVTKQDVKKIETTASIKSEWLNGGIEGRFERSTGDKRRVVKTLVSVDYALQDQAMQRIVLRNKVTDTSIKGQWDYTLTSGMTNTIAPTYNYDLRAHIGMADRSLVVALDGALNNDKTRSLYLRHNATFSLHNPMNRAAWWDTEVKLPHKNVDHSLRMEYKQTASEVSASGVVKAGDADIGLVNLHLEKSPTSRKVIGQLNYPGLEVELKEEFSKVGDNKYHFSGSLMKQQVQAMAYSMDIKTSPVIELDAEVTSPYIHILKVKGSYGHNLPEHLDTKIDISYGDQYKMDASAKLEWTNSEILISPKFSLKAPRGFVSARGELEIEMWRHVRIMLEAREDDDEMWLFSTDLILSKSRPAFSYNIEDNHWSYRGNYNGIFDHNHLGAVHDCHFESSFEITSSCKRHDCTRTVQGTFKLIHKDLKDAELIAELTFFSSHRDKPEVLSLELNYTLVGKSLKGNGKAIIKEHAMEIAFDGSVTTSTIIGNLLAQTTCHDRNTKILMGLNYTRDGRSSSTDAMILLDTKNEKVKLTMNRKQEFFPVYKNHGNISIVTTRSKFDHHTDPFNITWNRVQDGDHIITNAMACTPHTQHNLTFVSNIRDSIKTADMKLVSTCKYCSNVHTYQCTYTETPNSAKLEATAKYIDRVREVIRAVVNFDGPNINADIQSNLLMDHFRILLGNRKEDKDWVSYIKMYSHPHEQSFSGDLDLNDYLLSALELESKLRFDLSLIEAEFKTWSWIRRYYVNSPTHNTRELFEISVNIQKDGSPVKTLLDFGTRRKVTINIVTPKKGWENMNFDMENSGNMLDFVLKTNISHSSLSEGILLDLQSDISNIKNIKFKVDWRSPFTWARRLNTVYSHKTDQNNAVTVSGSIEMPAFQASFNHYLKFQSWYSFDSKTELIYGQNQKYSLETRHEVSEKSNGFIQLETPFANAEHLSLKFNYEGRIRDCKGNIAIGLDKHRIISVAIERYHERDIHFITRVTTPFEHYRTMGIDFNFVGYMDDYKQDWAFTLEDKRLAGQNNFYWKGTTIDYTSSMQTPVQGFESLIFTFKHDGPLDAFESHMTFQYSKGKSSIHSTFNYEQEKLSGRLDVNLAAILKPFFDVPNDVSFIIGHSGNRKDFQNTVRLNMYGDSIHAGSKFKIDGSDIGTSAHLTAPGYKVTLSANHVGELNDFKCKYLVQINDNKIAVNNEFQKGNDLINGNLNIETSFEGMKSLDGSFNYKSGLEHFSSLTVTSNGQEYKANHEVQIGDLLLFFKNSSPQKSIHSSCKAALHLPEQYSISFLTTKAMSNNNLTSTVILKANQYRITANSNLTLSETGFDEVEFHMSSPFTHYRTIKGILKPTIREQSIKCKMSLDIERRTYSGLANIWAYSNDSKGITLDLKSPLISLTTRSEYIGQWDDFQTRMDFTIDGMEYSANSDLKLKPDLLKLDAKAKIPEEYSIMLESKGELSEFGTTFIMGMNGQHIHATTAFKKRANDIDVAVNILTPFPSFERQVLKFTHSGHVNKFKTSGQLETSFIGYDNSGFNMEYTGHATQFSIVTDLYTPFHAIKTASLSINHQAGRNSLSSDIAINHNRNSLSGAVTYEKIGDNIKVFATIDSSFRGYEKFMVSFNKEGFPGDFHTAVTVNTPFETLSTFEFNIFHNGYSQQFSNGLVVNFNGNMIKGNAGFDITRGVKVRASAELPFEGMEKFTFRYNHNKDHKTYKTSVDIETPFENYKSIGFKSNILPSQHDLRVNLNINFIKAIEVNLINRIGRNRMTTSASLLLPDLRINLVNTFSRTLMRVAASGSVETSLMGMERLAYICDLDLSEEDMFHFTAKVDHPFTKYASPAIQVSVKVVEEWYRDFETTAVITTLTKTDPPINFNILHKVDDNRVSTSANLIFKNKKTNAIIEYSFTDDFSEWKGLLETPLKGYEQFSLSFRRRTTDRTSVYSGKLETPLVAINDPSFDIEIEKSRRMFRLSAAVTTPLKWITPITGSIAYEKQPSHTTVRGNVQVNEKFVRLISEFRKMDDFVKTSITTDTSFVGYENFGLYFEGRYQSTKVKTKINAVLPKALNTINPMLEITYNGRANDFSTKMTMQLPSKNIRPVSLSILHKAVWMNLNTEVKVSYGTLNYHGLMKLQTSPGLEFSTSYTMPTRDKFSLDFVHSGDEERFSTKVKVHVPYQEYADTEIELLHETLSNISGTSLKVFTPFRHIDPVTVTVQNTGHLKDFTTNVRARYNGQTVSLNGAFEKIGPNIKASGELHTPFANYEHFGFAFSHNENGRKIRTTGNIVLPFREYVSPSFDIDIRGTLNDFTTKVTLITPFQSIDPVVFTTHHRGELNDFQTTMNAQYQGQSVIASVSHKLSGENLLVSCMVETPLLGGKKYALSFEHQNVGNAYQTKLAIESPQLRDKLAFELTVHGPIADFRMTGKIETPFRILREMSFNFEHKGTLDDFNTKGHLVVDGQRFEEDIQYRQVQTESATSREAFGRLTTPWRSLQKVEISLSHMMSDSEWIGSAKGSYNKQVIDADFTLSLGNQKTLDITIKKPKPMRYTFTVDLTAASLVAFFNWDKRSTDNQMRVEASLKSLISESSTDREAQMKITHPIRNIFVKTGYKISNGKILTATQVEWGDLQSQKVHVEYVSTTTSRSDQQQSVSRLKLKSAVATAQMMLDHRVTAGRHYVTRLTIQTAETLTITSDITVTDDGFQRSLTVEHPHLGDLEKIRVTMKSKRRSDPILFERDLTIEFAKEKIDLAISLDGKPSNSNRQTLLTVALKHPSRDLDTNLRCLVSEEAGVLRGDVDFKYLMGLDRQWRTFSLRSHVNRPRKEFSIQLVTPVETFDISGRQTSFNSQGQRYFVKGAAEGQFISADFKVESSKFSIDIASTYTPGLHLPTGSTADLHLTGLYSSMDRLLLEAHHRVTGVKTEDFQFDIYRDGTHLIKTRVFARPGLAADAGEMLRRVGIGIGAATGYLDVFHQEMFVRYGYMVETLTQLGAPLRRMIQHNDYYLGDIWEYTLIGFTHARYLTERAATFVTSRMGEGLHQLQLIYIKSYEQTVRKVEAIYNQVANFAARHHHWIHRSLLDLANAVYNHPTTQYILYMLEDVFFDAISPLLKLYNLVTRPLVDFIYGLQLQSIRRWINYKLDYPFLPDWQGYLYDAYRTCLFHLKQFSLMSLRRAVWASVDQLHLEETRVTTWAPRRGLLEAQVYVPFVPEDIQAIQTLLSAPEEGVRYLRGLRAAIRRVVHEYTLPTDYHDWLPPFTAHAMIVGGKHYLTFDNKTYDFTGECSYLLARDFVDGTFSVVVNYHQENGVFSKKSLTVSHHSRQVEMYPDFRVLVNGRAAELPVISEHTAVYREGSKLIVDNQHGVKVTCEMPYDLCTVSVTGWYYGKIAGMLGTFNNEPSDDFTSGSGRRVTSPEALADSWTVGKHCNIINYAATSNDISPLPALPNYEVCEGYFKSYESVLGPCFGTVDPQRFMRMCVRGDACQIAAFYSRECSLNDVKVAVPGQCVRCEMPGGNELNRLGSEFVVVRDEGIPQTGDVIFVVSHGSCNRDVISHLPFLAANLERALKLSGLPHARFGLVGYGGQDAEAIPHSHTISGHLTNTRTAFSKVIRTFAIAPKVSPTEPDEALAAIVMATKYPFQAGTSKTVILVPCGGCSEGNVTVGMAERGLRREGIHFHVLTPQDIRLKAQGMNESPRSSEIYGLDRDTVYTHQDVGRTTEQLGNSHLRHQVPAPVDCCASLSVSNGGAVFTSGSLTQHRNRKSFVDVLSRVVASKAESFDCKMCRCEEEDGGAGAGRVFCKGFRPGPGRTCQL